MKQAQQFDMYVTLGSILKHMHVPLPQHHVCCCLAACPMNTMPMPVDVPSTAPHGTPAHGHHGHRTGGGHSWAPMAHRTAMAMISHCPAGTTVATVSDTLTTFS
jgi:hypothetical protein